MRLGGTLTAGRPPGMWCTCSAPTLRNGEREAWEQRGGGLVGLPGRAAFSSRVRTSRGMVALPRTHLRRYMRLLTQRMVECWRGGSGAAARHPPPRQQTYEEVLRRTEGVLWAIVHTCLVMLHDV